MHPPFIFTNHKVGPDIFDPKPKVRRNRPERQRVAHAANGWPTAPAVPPQAGGPLAPSGHPIAPGFQMQVVPPPQGNWRDTFGRWLIRTGQRMILENRPG